MSEASKDPRVEIAIHNWAPRFVSAGVPLADFNEVTAAISRWEDWCRVWSERAAVVAEIEKSAARLAQTV